MIREELKQLKTGPIELRKFGLMVGVVFALLAAWFAWRGKSWFPYLLAPGALLMIFGLVAPRALRTVYLGWMTLAFVLGFVVSHVVLTVFFYIVVTPIGLAARLFGKDFLRRRLDRQTGSYWIIRDRSLSKRAKDYEQQY